MIRLSANLSKKVPLPGIDYSSQQYGASLEIEISDADKPEVIQGRIKELYVLLSNAIDEQLVSVQSNTGNASPPAGPAAQPVRQSAPQQRNGAPVNRLPAANGNGSGNGRRVTATEAQVKCIYAITKASGLNLTEILADYNCTDPKQLHIKDASTLIDKIKNGNDATAR
jgi:hypothetical protein